MDKTEKKVYKTTVYGNPFVGLFGKTNDKITFVGKTIPEKFLLNSPLNTDIFKIKIGNSDLIGIYVAMNNNGVVITNLVENDELVEIKSILKNYDLNIEILDSKFTAVGNNIVSNDKGCIVNPNIELHDIKKIRDALGVEVEKFSVCGYKTIGATILATNKGFITHPLVSEEEFNRIKEILKVRGGVGTANMGVPFVPLSAIANSKGFITGETTTGYEIHRISECLDLI